MSEIKMLEHQKLLLKNLSNDSVMFQKELEKSIKWLRTEDLHELYAWLKTNCWQSHEDIIKAMFEKRAVREK